MLKAITRKIWTNWTLFATDWTLTETCRPELHSSYNSFCRLVYLLICLLVYLFVCLLECLSLLNCIPAYLPALMFAHMLAWMPACMLACMLACMTEQNRQIDEHRETDRQTSIDRQGEKQTDRRTERLIRRQICMDRWGLPQTPSRIRTPSGGTVHDLFVSRPEFSRKL